MPPPQTIFHALLRPCILQVLRATGYHSCKPAVLDSLTDLASRYLALLCHQTAVYATENDSMPEPTVVDVRMALQDAGALLPERPFAEQEFLDEEDVRGVEEFIRWFAGAQNRQIMELSKVDGEPELGDYLNALKKKHSKTGEDSKYHGTILGKGNDHGEVLVEGGEVPSIEAWTAKMRGPSPPPRPDSSASDSRPPSSGLSSVGDRLDEDMDFS